MLKRAKKGRMKTVVKNLENESVAGGNGQFNAKEVYDAGNFGLAGI